MKKNTDNFHLKIQLASNGDEKAIRFIRSLIADCVEDCPVHDLLELARALHRIAERLDKEQVMVN